MKIVGSYWKKITKCKKIIKYKKITIQSWGDGIIREGIEAQNNDISLMKPKTLLQIMLTMIPQMMTEPSKNNDILAFSDLL